jgi:cytoplasmic iron level regulating protein YaaA (DUF328/UPF0246 family)
MLTLLSPAKTLDYETPLPALDQSKPALLKDSAALARLMKSKTVADLKSMMKISDALAALNAERFKSWHTSHTPETARQAFFAFKGDVYLGLDAQSLSKRDVQFAQKSIRILSGLYGVVKPLDLIRPYRLEMGRTLETPRGQTLYDYWKTPVTETIQNELASQKRPVLVNLASNEYFKVVDKKRIDTPIIQPVFKEKTANGYQLISFFAKKARGMMARYIIKNRIDQVEKLKAFDDEGYRFNEALSSDHNWVFTRTA